MQHERAFVRDLCLRTVRLPREPLDPPASETPFVSPLTPAGGAPLRLRAPLRTSTGRAEPLRPEVAPLPDALALTLPLHREWVRQLTRWRPPRA